MKSAAATASYVGRARAIDAMRGRLLVPADCGAQGVGHPAARIGIAELLAEDQLARLDRATLTFAGNAAATESLVRTRQHAKRLGEGNTARTMRDLLPFVQHEGLVPRGGNVRGLVGRERALAGLGHEVMLLP